MATEIFAGLGIFSLILTVLLVWALPIWITSYVFKNKFTKVVLIIIVFSIIQAVLITIYVKLFTVDIDVFSKAASIMGILN